MFEKRKTTENIGKHHHRMNNLANQQQMVFFLEMVLHDGDKEHFMIFLRDVGQYIGSYKIN
jgi:hypothetical protein